MYNFKKIRTVPTSEDFVDIVLSKTQRKTPTVVHAGYAIGRIRSFYMRKVKYTQESFTEKLDWILEDFPKLDDIHPFYADLCNVLYDREHYKLALGQLNVAKNLIMTISRDYVRLLKYADSLYRCKQLKRAALGRMCTLLKKHKASLSYLEEVRKHLSRLPNIDPNTRTLLITGYPNVGKSSFLNKITRADVEVQPYAFTTKSLFVGHFDYKYLRYQVIDTPGISDKPLEERNTIEMQAITALAHLQSCILYFLDLSEQCGFSLKQQISLFENISPLFINKPLVIVANKVDIIKLNDLEPAIKKRIDDLVEKSGATLVEMSSHHDIGVTDVKREACEKLFEVRLQRKMNSNKLGNIINRITVANPESRDSKDRPAFIPETVLRRRELAAQGAEIEKRKTERDLMWENGGPGVYSSDYKKLYDLKDDEKYDVIPEIIDGKNISDFIDPDILKKLDELEREEEEYFRKAGIDVDDDIHSDLDEQEKHLLKTIKVKKVLMAKETRIKKSNTNNRTKMARKHEARRENVKSFKKKLAQAGYDETQIDESGFALVKKRKQTPVLLGKRGREDDMDVDSQQNSKKRKSIDKTETSMTSAQRKKVPIILNRDQRSLRGTAGESDRRIQEKMPKHLFSGKRGLGKTQRR